MVMHDTTRTRTRRGMARRIVRMCAVAVWMLTAAACCLDECENCLDSDYYYEHHYECEQCVQRQIENGEEMLSPAE